ncbi:DUF2612 domain-containing protein [Lelliottia wanjuensis]|uniref:DUF2612 domain-containing protein n=1 Tax=Lelliottia wanjuensis TaxID=3050585 RepID=UPI00254F9FF4|nr:DUF2612 domain-containing protein [Lelliottia sp. V104_15]MDK9607121.1 DUF2612 domain-containing protein [Lelliottia sp. V104_15]
MSTYSDLLVIQYADKPRARATINLLADQWAQSFSGAASIPEMLNIDTSAGVNLDIVGKIVGQDRTLSGAVAREYFAFVGNPKTKGFRISKVGGSPWYHHGDALNESVSLTDAEMRTLIRARCVKNFSNCKIDDVERACELLFGASGYLLDQLANSVWQITTFSAENFVLFAAKTLDILPRAAGVRYEFIEG